MGDEDKLAELREIIDAMNRAGYDGPIKTSGEVFPADLAPVIASGRDLKPGVFAMRWGYALPGGRRIINARSETADMKPLFSEGMARHRCVVPADHYFEWTHAGRTRDKYAIRPDRDGAIYMAGIYRLEQGRPVFAIVTRASSDPVSFLHDRMPVILPRALTGDWIDPRRNAKDLLACAITDLQPVRVAPQTEQMRIAF
ncbi:MAG: SOS response-associated peptidase [Clostridia bacterium]|nr:SOS response-associated peptidase [Clostridia bacterium]